MKLVLKRIHDQVLWNPFVLVLFGVLSILLIGVLLIAVGMR